MSSESQFGAGLFDESKSKESTTPSVPQPVSTPEPVTEKHAAPPAPSGEVNETPNAETENENPNWQAQRDQEKAMLLRRSRQEASVDTRPIEAGKVNAPSPRWRGPAPRQGQFTTRRGNGDRPATPEAAIAELPKATVQAPTPATNTWQETPREARPERRPSPSAVTSERSETQIPTTGPLLLDQRVGILVDVQNMYHSARKSHGRNLSYSKLIQNTVKGRKLVRAIAYLIEREGVDQVGFLEHLTSSGFEVRRKTLIERADGTRKGDWDLGMAIDAITLCEKVDALILVTGDGDFTALQPVLRQRGVKFEVASFRESSSEALIGSADQFHALGKDSLY